jgi:hypothetical protein
MKYFLFPFFSRVSESKDLLSKNYKEIEKKEKERSGATPCSAQVVAAAVPSDGIRKRS